VAKELRERIEKMITLKTCWKSSCRNHVRSILKKQVPDSNVRSKLLNEILNNHNIKQVLKEGKLREAQEIAMKLIEKKETK